MPDKAGSVDLDGVHIILWCCQPAFVAHKRIYILSSRGISFLEEVSQIQQRHSLFFPVSQIK